MDQFLVNFSQTPNLVPLVLTFYSREEQLSGSFVPLKQNGSVVNNRYNEWERYLGK